MARRLLKKRAMKNALKVLTAVAVTMGAVTQAHAGPITVTPTTTVCGSPTCVVASGNESGQNDINAKIATALGITVPQVVGLLKYSDGPADPEQGVAASWYTTTFNNADLADSDARITWDGPGYINSNPVYALIKDGNATPNWFFFNISGWNGKDNIEFAGFFNETNKKGETQYKAVSHVSLYGNSTTPGDTPVPDGGSMAMLLGMSLMGIAAARRMLS